jgi:ribose transport system permease protein
MTATTPPPTPAPTLEYRSPYEQRQSVVLSVLAQLGPAIGLLCVIILFSVLRWDTFATIDNWQVMLMQTAVVGTAALGMTIVIVSGGIDLSVGSNIALTTVVVATLLQRGWPPMLAIVGGIISGALVGLFIGAVVSFVDLAPFIVTLGLWGGLRGLAKGLAHETTVDPGRDTWLNHILHMLDPNQHWMLVPPGVWVMIVLSVLTAGLLRYTRFGRHVFAIGSNELTARLCGVPVARNKIMIYILGGMFAAVAGIMQFSSLTIGDPTTANGKELDVIAAVVIGGASLSGGQGTITGSIIGALLMTVIANGCTKVGLTNWVQEIVTGGIIILAAAVDRLRRGKLPRLL